MTFGNIEVVIHEVNVTVSAFGRRVWRIAYHITDNERRDSVGRPLRTPTAWIFVADPEITEEEKAGKTAAQLAELWVKKWSEALRENLEQAVKIYKDNRDVFMR